MSDILAKLVEELESLKRRIDQLSTVEYSTGGASDAADITYTPNVDTDWDGDADPGDLDDAVDQLAERVDDNEIAIAGLGGGGGVDAADVTYTSGTDTDWDGDADPGNVDDALDQLAERVDDNEIAITGIPTDAGDLTYTPTVATDWDSDADPGNVDDALDQLAERVDDNEIAISGIPTDAGDLTYTPTTAADWDGDADPGDLDDALDQLAERTQDLEDAGVSALKQGDFGTTGVSFSTSAYAWKGDYLKPLFNMDIYSVGAFGDWDNGSTIKFGIFTVSGGAVASVLGKTPGISIPGDYVATVWDDFSTPISLTAGTTYLIMVGRSDGAGNYALPIWYPAGSGAMDAPLAHVSPYSGRVADADPAASDSVNDYTGTVPLYLSYLLT